MKSILHNGNEYPIWDFEEFLKEMANGVGGRLLISGVHSKTKTDSYFYVLENLMNEDDKFLMIERNICSFITGKSFELLKKNELVEKNIDNKDSGTYYVKLENFVPFNKKRIRQRILEFTNK